MDYTMALIHKGMDILDGIADPEAPLNNHLVISFQLELVERLGVHDPVTKAWSPIAAGSGLRGGVAIRAAAGQVEVNEDRRTPAVRREDQREHRAAFEADARLWRLAAAHHLSLGTSGNSVSSGVGWRPWRP